GQVDPVADIRPSKRVARPKLQLASAPEVRGSPEPRQRQVVRNAGADGEEGGRSRPAARRRGDLGASVGRRHLPEAKLQIREEILERELVVDGCAVAVERI